MMPSLIEAAVRAVLLGLAVWTGLRIFRVRNVLAQKAAWGLVLAMAFLMPMLMQWRSSIDGAALTVPADRVAQLKSLFAAPEQRENAARASEDGVLVATRTPIATRAAEANQAMDADRAPAQALAARKRVAAIRRPSSDAISSYEASQANESPSASAPAQFESRASVMSDVYTGPPVSAPTALPVRRTADISFSTIAWLIYFGVAGALLLRLLYGLGCALRLWQSAEPIESCELPAFAAGVPLRVSRSIPSPVTIGSGVVLPADYSDWDTEKLRIVLAHERSHIRQGDFYLQLLAGFYAAFVWFSPLGWWLKSKLSDLGETISDRAGLEQAQSGASYAQILLEFAAAPRATTIGVAMARTGAVSGRIERLLNDSAFRQAFSGGRRRILIAVLLVPVALYAATALVRVQAAQSAPAATPAAQAAPANASPAATAAPAATPEPAPASEAESDAQVDSGVVVPATPAAPVSPVAPTIHVAPVAPVVAPSIRIASPMTLSLDPGAIRVMANDGRIFALAQADGAENRHSYHYRYSMDGDSYAVIRGDHRETMNFSGDMDTGDIDKARKLAHGDFLWFARDGKEYFVDDQATLAQIEAMYKPIEELGKQQEELGRQEEELGKQQEALGRQQEQASLPAPDMQKEMAAIHEAMAKIEAKMGKNVTQDELGDLQGKLGDLQGRLGDLQGKIGDVQGKFGEQQGQLGEQQGRLGAEQGRLGAQQGRLSRDADRKVRSIIDESLQNGKAHPVN
jgi:beta-lactamase regulating signal transducer with metallopeptidase domain